MWPPTQGPNYSNTSKLLPSSIKFEESEQENTGGSSIDEDKRPFESEGKDNLLQQSSLASSSKVMRQASDCEGKHVCRQLSSHAGGDQRLASGRAEDRDQAKHASDNCTCHRQSSEVERRASLQASGGERREDKTVIAEDSDGDAPNTGEKRRWHSFIIMIMQEQSYVLPCVLLAQVSSVYSNRLSTILSMSSLSFKIDSLILNNHTEQS